MAVIESTHQLKEPLSLLWLQIHFQQCGVHVRPAGHGLSRPSDRSQEVAQEVEEALVRGLVLPAQGSQVSAVTDGRQLGVEVATGAVHLWVQMDDFPRVQVTFSGKTV